MKLPVNFIIYLFAVTAAYFLGGLIAAIATVLFIREYFSQDVVVQKVSKAQKKSLKPMNLLKEVSPEIVKHLRVLGLKNGSGLLEVKDAYQSLFNDLSPTKTKGLDEIIQNYAKEKREDIHASYEYLKENYV
jgi:hypothetical protein